MTELIVEQLESEAAQALDFASVVARLRARSPWIQTRSGRRFPFLAPRFDDVDLRDIAYALSNLARFTGHTRRGEDGAIYSVAQHSVLVSHAVPEKHALVGLMHDAPEAYLGDVSSPLKSLLPDFKRLESLAWAAIAEAFDLPLDLPPTVKEADLRLLATEKRDLLGPEPAAWFPMPDPLPERIDPWPAPVAEQRFLERFAELMGSGEHT